ncbi:hypothetical protein [Neobacillus soli]|uniref:hypothetical protein n=1 Tax=Neobacillus soli TaxID=220688 RepID=UPI001F2474C6|nr:hypothetical protein [Neobacillus soli]
MSIMIVYFVPFSKWSKIFVTFDVLTKLADEIGLDEKELRTALENRTYREEHQKALQ